MTDQPNLEDMPLGGLRETDHLFVDTHDHTCSRCREVIVEAEVPLLLWLNDGKDMYAFCTRCTWDPQSDRCKVCGCTERNPCEEVCGWKAPGLCTNCDERNIPNASTKQYPRPGTDETVPG